MTSPLAHDPSDDLSALAWVHDELRRSLEAAHKSLRRFVREAEAVGVADLDAVDPAVLRTARSQIHQGVGALELVGLPEAATLLRASEALIQRIVAKPQRLNAEVIEAVERASFGLLDYLTRLLAGKTVSPLALFPQYRAVQEAAGADRVHPADLWSVDWQWRDLPEDPTAPPRAVDAAARGALEAQLLVLMKTSTPTVPAARMSEICAGLGRTAPQPQTSTFWKLASAVFEAQAHGLLGFDVFSKRVASRLLVQFRALERGDAQVSERLAQDLLFFCAQSDSPGDGRAAPRLAAVRQAYGLLHHVPADYSASPLGRFDPTLILQGRKRVVAAKEAWSAVAAGEMHRLSGLSEQFALVGESLKRLFPLGDLFSAELQHAVLQTQQAASPPPAPLAMEVATSLLYVEAVLEDADFDHPEQAERVRRLAERLATVRQGRAPEPLEGWMEELYRRVSDRQTMGSVVQELRASLSEAEKSIDAFFRNPIAHDVLIAVPNQLSAMRGVLSVLGMDHAAAALLRMRDEVDGLITTEIEPQHIAQAGVFDRLAGNLGALGFLIDMLSVQPQMAKSLFTYDAGAGTLSPVMGREAQSAGTRAAAAAQAGQRLIEQAQSLAFNSVRSDVSDQAVARDLDRLSQEAIAADQPSLAATVQKALEAIDEAASNLAVATARGELSEALVDFVASVNEPAGLGTSAPLPLGTTPLPTIDSGLGDDEEMREVFLEEAREVLADAAAARADLAHAPDDLPMLTTLRRAFHTLKGSSRMVGLKEFGDAAWAGEQLYNTHLADQKAAGAPLLDFTAWCLGYLNAWVDAITARRRSHHDAATVRAAAAAVVEGRFDAAFVPEPAALLPPDLPGAPALDLSDLASASPARRVGPDAPAPADALSFDFDLADLDTPFDAREHAISAAMPLDLSTAALQAPFESSAPTGPTPFPELEPVPALPAEPELPSPETLERLAADAAWLPEFAVEPDQLGDAIEFDLDLSAVRADAVADFGANAEAAADPSADATAQAEADARAEDEQVRIVGPLRISIPLFNIYLNEADELSRRLGVEVAEWALELHRPIGELPIALAHSLAGSSATVGFADLSQLARLLEHAQARSQAIGHGTEEEGQLFADSADEIRHLLHQFAAGFLKEPSAALIARLADHERSSALRLQAATAAAEVPVDSAQGSLEAPLFELIFADEALAATPAPDARETAVAALPSLELRAFDDLPDLATGVGEPAPAAATDAWIQGFGHTEFKSFDERPAPPRPMAATSRDRADDDERIDAVDAIDAELFPIFTEEARELLPQLSSRLRDWARRPTDTAPPSACMRTLHTLKGGARLAGAMRLGEMAHRIETRIEHLVAAAPVEARDIEALQAHGDALTHTFEALCSGDLPALADAEYAFATADEGAAVGPAPTVAAAVPAEPEVENVAGGPGAPDTVVHPVSADSAVTEVDAAVAPRRVPPSDTPSIDWSRFAADPSEPRQATERAQSVQSSVRVRAPVLDRLVNQAGEVSITRSRIESSVAQMKGSLADLTENLGRLRTQLRDLEFHGEVQMTSRMEAAKAAAQSFDPLEFDRFTRFQELTRMMAESVNDVATVQRSVQRAIEVTEDELVAQARLTRDLQDDLLRTRMVEFEGLSDRLYRVVRQAAKETGKSVRLDILGGGVEVDRGVLDRMTGAFEHLLRNSVAHGIETPAQRTAAGKEATGSVTVALSHEGNEVGVEFRDDGAGLHLPRIRAKAVALGLIDADAQPSAAQLADLIFVPGFTTAEGITELAGRGVGMDVVRSEVAAMGGRIETATRAGQGTSFKLVLPLTTAVTQVVMLRCGQTRVAVPSTLVEAVRRATPEEVDAAYASGAFTPFGAHAEPSSAGAGSADGSTLPFYWLGALLQIGARPAESGARTRMVVTIRSARQRIAVHVDEVLGNQEVVVKNLGPQLSRMPGLAGVTLLASGTVALIYNPVALATLYGASAQAMTRAAGQAPGHGSGQGTSKAPDEPLAPLVLVVDDSLTVRRVTQRLLVREGYRVALAKDGLDALERLAEEVPQIVLSDIEMPRMDGFDLVRNMRADARLRDLPVIMITSRIAQKHRDYAAELGVDHYLGKPYAEEDLLALVARYTAQHVAA